MVPFNPRKHRFPDYPRKIFWRLPVTVHSIEPLFLKNKEQVAEIFLGTWPIISLCLTTDTTKGLNALPDCRKQGNTCPDLASHKSL